MFSLSSGWLALQFLNFACVSLTATMCCEVFPATRTGPFGGRGESCFFVMPLPHMVPQSGIAAASIFAIFTKMSVLPMLTHALITNHFVLDLVPLRHLGKITVLAANRCLPDSWIILWWQSM